MWELGGWGENLIAVERSFPTLRGMRTDVHRRNFIKRGPSPSLMHLQRAERTIVLSLPLTDTPGILSRYSSLGHPQPGGQLLTILGGISLRRK